MTLAVIGTRTFEDYQLLCSVLDGMPGVSMVSKVVSGAAKGADELGALWARSRGIEVKEYPAKWREGGVYNPRAGFERNQLIVNDADCVICFWDGNSRGTRDSIQKALKVQKPVGLVIYTSPTLEITTFKDYQSFVDRYGR